MLIRSIEFQDSFTRVPVQGARQLSLDLNRPDQLHRHMAQLGMEQAVEDQSRSMPSQHPEDKGIDPNSRPLPEQRRDRKGRRRPEDVPADEEKHPPHVGETGTQVDFVA